MRKIKVFDLNLAELAVRFYLMVGVVVFFWLFRPVHYCFYFGLRTGAKFYPRRKF